MMNILVASEATSTKMSEVKEHEPRQFLTFNLKEELFCLPIESIKEIIGVSKITPVPMVPDFIRGIINIRGLVVPVIDLSVRFGWPKSDITKRSCVVIIEIEHEDNVLVLGLIIDSVSEVIEMTPSDIGEAPSFGSKIRTDFISNMLKINDEFVVVLDVHKVLSVDELSMMQEVSERGE